MKRVEHYKTQDFIIMYKILIKKSKNKNYKNEMKFQMELKNKNSTAIKIQFFKKDVGIDSILISSKSSYGKKSIST